MREVRQFLGLASYYRRFVKGFAATAQPLHSLTKANSCFSWSIDCQEAIDTLKSKLLMAPVLSFPDFSRDFILETDASVKGLGAVLSQRGEDDKVLPVAYASCAMSPQEQRYSVTELETLTVVWAIKHYLAYLYGNSVVVYTDHSAVRAVLNSPISMESTLVGGAKFMVVVLRTSRSSIGLVERTQMLIHCREILS